MTCRVLPALVALLSTPAVVGCGGSSDSEGGGASACGAEDCGGDIVGTWEVDELCGFEQDEQGFEGCPEAALTSNFEATGTATFDADGTGSVELTVFGTLVMSLPEECLTFEGIALTCDQAESLLQQSFEEQEAAEGIDMFGAVSCSGSGDCDCDIEMNPQTETSSGTYQVDGNRLTTIDEDGAEENGFCVDGDTLVLSNISDAPGEEDTQIVFKR